MSAPVPSPTLKSALATYFEENGFGPDGGYSSNWVDFMLGPIPFPFPNTPARKRAVRYHDLHHLLTGYRTDVRGEFEISAWEIGSGCRDFVAAWQLNLSGMAGGVFLCPRRTFRAFLRGRRSENFYGRSYDDALLATRVAEARTELGVDRPLPPPTVLDVLLFVAAAASGLVLGLAFLAVCAPLALVAYPFLVAARRAPRPAPHCASVQPGDSEQSAAGT
ncbi:MAG TPA: hypothetical protein VHE30_03830 [Polyangiaceae bacterium]|nr:hypothetical protein [Polyangiaceae bacterium]